MRVALSFLLLAALVFGQQNDKFTLLKTRTLPDGREVHSIQEHEEELPDLPTDEEEEVMVPVDESGNVVPGNEHLLQPRVFLINRNQLEKLNNSKSVNVQGPSSESDNSVSESVGQPIESYPPSQSVSLRPAPERNDIDTELTQGTDYDEAAAVPDSRLPKITDYVDSKEKDPEVETGEDFTEKELQKIEEEIQNKKEQEKEENEQQMKEEETEVSEDVSAIVQEAKEMAKAEEEEREEGLKEFIKELSETDPDEEEAKDRLLPTDRSLAPVSEIKEEPVKEKPVEPTQKVDAPGPKGYTLDATSLEKGEERRPSRIHKGEIIGKRKQPDGSAAISWLPLLIFTQFLFV